MSDSTSRRQIKRILAVELQAHSSSIVDTRCSYYVTRDGRCGESPSVADIRRKFVEYVPKPSYRSSKNFHQQSDLAALRSSNRDI
jgi:hypothetical protein